MLVLTLKQTHAKSYVILAPKGNVIVPETTHNSLEDAIKWAKAYISYYQNVTLAIEILPKKL